MSDIKCVQCGEPWDSYYVQQDMSREERHDLINGLGCPACEGEEIDRGKAAVMSEVAYIMGDDLDWMASEMSDGGLEFLLD